MNKKIEPKKPLTAEQDFAATPTENVWVQANAGTGKTSVLVERLLRVFFRTSNLSNVGILCLTYTITGASVMRNKILAALSDWACATDDQVRDLLQGIAYNQPATDADIARAREIFFFFIDNPDVLKIKTFHSFCEEILHRFPDEAGLSPAWSVISGEVQKNLQRDAFDKMIDSSLQDMKNDVNQRSVSSSDNRTAVGGGMGGVSESDAAFIQAQIYPHWNVSAP